MSDSKDKPGYQPDRQGKSRPRKVNDSKEKEGEFPPGTECWDFLQLPGILRNQSSKVARGLGLR
jgi:hypothetical protein